MTKSIRLVAMTATTLILSRVLLANADQPAVSLNAARVGAVDVSADARFYQAAFGLQEVRRFEFPGTLEILMNFGASVDAAKANTNPQIVIMQRKSDATTDPMPHLILTVTDMNATAAAVKAAGGKMDGEPREFGKTGIMIGFAIDAAGNRIEMIQQPRK
jgi:predicted enzyme related to lactoylglutathione lyase